MGVLLDKNAIVLSRALPCLEMLSIIEQRLPMDLACPSGVLAATQPFSEGWEFGSFDGKLAELILAYDVSKIEGKVVDCCDHAEMTKCRVARLPYKNGDLAPKECEAYDIFNMRLQSKAFGPVLRSVVAMEALLAGNNEKLMSTLHSDVGSAVSLTNFSLHGLLGETALHIAAAGGHTGALTMLLQSHANPNQQDNHGETALHYAALAGEFGAFKVLVDSGASLSLESYFMETAREVAEENAAAVLSVNTNEIVAFCNEHKARRRRDGPNVRNKVGDTVMPINNKICWPWIFCGGPSSTSEASY